MPDGTSHYIFGFVNLTGVPDNEVFSRRGRAQLLAPLLDTRAGQPVELTLTNVGLPERPDLDDSHTIHWHGFPNQIPVWDGVPEASIAVPVGRDLIYYYEPQDPGTYMYHCHFEPVEHIQMGMIGPLVARPVDYDPASPGTRTAYGAGTGTEFDREYWVFVTEMDPVAHDQIHKVQEYDWTEYRPKYWLINGRAYPDTIETAPRPDLASQPFPCLIRASEGDKVLLRFVNLGFEEHSITILGLSMRLVGRDAKLLRGINGEDLSHSCEVLYLGAGETVDAIIQAHRPGIYPLFNRCYHKNNNAGASPGGMMAHVQVLQASIPAPVS
jgi:FtsP/CotA-like multicopper oxidase with cupredoxin domain